MKNSVYSKLLLLCNGWLRMPCSLHAAEYLAYCRYKTKFYLSGLFKLDFVKKKTAFRRFFVLQIIYYFLAGAAASLAAGAALAALGVHVPPL